MIEYKEYAVGPLVGLVVLFFAYRTCWRKKRTQRQAQVEGPGEVEMEQHREQYRQRQQQEAGEETMEEVKIPTAEDKLKERREHILRTIIHKKVISKRNIMMRKVLILPHEKIVSDRALSVVSSNADPNDQLQGEDFSHGSTRFGGLSYFSSVAASRIIVPPSSTIGDEESAWYSWKTRSTLSSASAKRTRMRMRKSDIPISSTSIMSIREERGIPMDKGDSESLFSPKTCPICCEDYIKGDDIAWSQNEKCFHAYHVDCILGWLMEHDDCPMCRMNYLEAPASVTESTLSFGTID